MKNNWQAWSFTALAVVFLVVDATRGFQLTREHWFFLLVCGGCLLVSIWSRRRGEAAMPKFSADKFLDRLEKTTAGREALLAARSRVAGVLSLQPESLDPRQKLDELSERVDFVGTFQVALNDLLAELEESGLKEAEVARIVTVGELVEAFATVRRQAA